MIVGVHKVICTCDKEMRRTGGTFGGEITSDTYYCDECKKHIIVVTPKKEEQAEFSQRVQQN